MKRWWKYPLNGREGGEGAPLKGGKLGALSHRPTHLSCHNSFREGRTSGRQVRVGGPKRPLELAVAPGKHSDEGVLHVGSKDEDEADGHPHVYGLGVRYSGQLKMHTSSIDIDHHSDFFLSKMSLRSRVFYSSSILFCL